MSKYTELEAEFNRRQMLGEDCEDLIAEMLLQLEASRRRFYVVSVNGRRTERQRLQAAT